MELKRKPFQGVMNIIRFNWHFYAVAAAMLIAFVFIKPYLPAQIQEIAAGFALLGILTIIVSLTISFYVYDLSDLYQIKWLTNADNKRILTINAGFDETTAILKNKYPNSEWIICDFYHPDKHTEISIKRARQAYPPLENTIQVSTDKLPFEDHSFDYVLAILSAHEIRDEQERIHFFAELHRVTKTEGQIFVTEHLRDFPNFMAYTIGFLHFHSKTTWLRTFEHAKLKVKHKIKTTPFITTFILQQNGNTP